MVCKPYGIPYCAHSLNAPCLYIKYWPQYGSLEPKHVANYVLMTIQGVPGGMCQTSGECSLC